MADEPQNLESTDVATAEPEGDKKPPKLDLAVDIRDAGPCRKHVKVAISRANIDRGLNEKFSEMMTDTEVAGYRPGKAPRKLIEKRFHKDVSERLKTELLLQSLEQIGEDHALMPITQPNIDPFKIEMPAEGPLEYEFEVEVAPEFDLPEYKGLKLKRPVHEFNEEEVDRGVQRYLSNFGTLVPKDGPAEMGDYLIVDVTTRTASQEIGTLKDITVKVDPQLAFSDGIIKNFAEKIKGAKAGETRELEIALSNNVANPGLRGITADMSMTIKDVKTLRLPELDEHFLGQLGLKTPEQLREKIRAALKRQLDYEQRRVAREQVLQQITSAASWQLPPDLLRRQAQKTLNRQIIEMRSAGFAEEEIRSRAAMLQQDAIANSEKSLKEYFVLQKISEVEKIEVDKDDVDYEIRMIAAETNESPRRVRARLEKEDMMEAIAAQIIERKALDLVLDSAKYEDVLWKKEETGVGGVQAQITPEEKEEEKPAETPGA